MTSNRKPADLYFNGINRSVFLPFIQLIKDTCIVMDMEASKDYRLSGQKTTNVYICPPSHTAIDNIFNQLTHGEVAEPDILDVNGRQIMVPLVARGVAKFNFADLCFAQMSASDYIKICETYHTIIVSEIPYFNLNMRDVLRRFILLVDEVYQHHVKFICSAYDKPELLLKETKSKSEYENIDEVFAFDRTISRLNEMQTISYLQASQSHRK
jgi:predicted ATPase